MLDVLEALERRLARVTGGRDEDDGVLAVIGLFERLGQQVRKDLQRHVLERTGGTVPKLEDVQLGVAELCICHRRGIIAAEFCGGVCLFDALVDLFFGKVGQKIGEHLFGSALVVCLQQRPEGRLVISGKFLRDEQAAVLGNTFLGISAHYRKKSFSFFGRDS